METKTQALYKVQAVGWRDPEYSVACDQMEAIRNVMTTYTDMEPQTCSVIYVGKAYTEQGSTMEALRHDNEAMARQLMEKDEEIARLADELDQAKVVEDELRKENGNLYLRLERKARREERESQQESVCKEAAE